MPLISGIECEDQSANLAQASCDPSLAAQLGSDTRDRSSSTAAEIENMGTLDNLSAGAQDEETGRYCRSAQDCG